MAVVSHGHPVVSFRSRPADRHRESVEQHATENARSRSGDGVEADRKRSATRVRWNGERRNENTSAGFKDGIASGNRARGHRGGDLRRDETRDADLDPSAGNAALGDHTPNSTLLRGGGGGSREDHDIERIRLVVGIVQGRHVSPGAGITEIELDEVSDRKRGRSLSVDRGDNELVRRESAEVSSRNENSGNHVCVPPLGLCAKREGSDNAMTLAAVAEQV